MDHKQIVEFISAIEPLKDTLRHNWTTNGRQESSAEHTWRIAMLFIVLNDLINFKIDQIKTLKMILLHDIPELIDGDVPGFDKQQSDVDNEVENARTIFNKLPEPLATEYFNLFVEFEENNTPESKVAKALDRIESQLQHLDSGPEYWNEQERGQVMVSYPDPQVSKLNHPDVTAVWDYIKSEIQAINQEYGY